MDRYGQRKDGTWPRKVSLDAEIIEADEQEQSLLDPVTPFAERDKYQAWASGLKQPRAISVSNGSTAAGGSWRPTAGCSSPPESMSSGTVSTVPSTRTQAAYEWLPPRQGPFAKAWRGQSVSLHIVNQIRKWGESYEARYRERAMRRQLFWGFTSLGNWSDWELLRGVP